jgi:hypothetical protein
MEIQWHSNQITAETELNGRRAARAQTEDKQRKREEKAARRKAERGAGEAREDTKQS